MASQWRSPVFPKWFQSKCTNITTGIILGLMPLGSSWAAQPALPKLLQEVKAKYAKTGTLSADFSQVNEDAALTGKKKQSSGKILVKRPKIRWEIQKPNPSLLISDGQSYWFYTPPFDEGERGQVIVKKASQIQSKLVDALLSGSFTPEQFSKIIPKGDRVFQLVPKLGTSGTVALATIEVDSEKKLIQKVSLEHKGGNRTEVTLSNIDLGTSLEDSLFRFSPPPNTDVVK